MIGLKYKDTIQIYDTTKDGYGDETVSVTSDVNALFIQGTGTTHASNVDNLVSDAHAYIDPNNEFVRSHWNRLEGMLIKAKLFGSDDKNSWYRIATVRVGQDKLLTNSIDNIHIYLTKSQGI